MCGDSTDKANVELLMNGAKADMVFTDPPYNVDFNGSVNPDGSKSQNANHGTIKNDKMNAENWLVFLDGFMKNLISFCDGALYIAMSCRELSSTTDSFRRNGGKWSSYIIWKKQSANLSMLDYHSHYEPILYGWPKNKKRYFIGDRTLTDVWEINKTRVNDLHPTMKPIELCAKAIHNSSKANNIVLDLFLGSGSTLIACEQTDRTCYGMELDPKYVDVIRKRYAKFISPDNTLPENWEELTPAIERELSENNG